MVRNGPPSLREREHRTGHGRAARHVALHALHAVGRLDGHAAGIERDALADETNHRRRRRVLRLVTDHDEPGRHRAAARDTEEQLHLQVFDAMLVQHVDGEARAAGGRRHPIRKLFRRQHVGRLIRQAARDVGGLRSDDASLDGRRNGARRPGQAAQRS